MSGLRANGAEVIECRADWRDPKRYRILWKSLRALHGQYDCVFAAYPSPVPAMLARIISRKPVVADAFYSMFDAVVNDRRKRKPWSLKALKLLVFDWLGIMVPDLVITDTDAHAAYWSSWWLVPKKKIRTVRIGANDAVYHPLPPRLADGIIRVHFHGTYVPLQGGPTIVEAARLCADDARIRFRMIGGPGGNYTIAKALADSYKLTNIEFIPEFKAPAELNRYMAESDIILGIFGDSDKARRVVPNKVCEGLAARRAVITMDTPAIREVFSGAELCLVAGDAASIAAAIRTLANDPSRRQVLAEAGHTAVARFYPKPLGADLLKVLTFHIK